jgi:hypothetical protein
MRRGLISTRRKSDSGARTPTFAQKISRQAGYDRAARPAQQARYNPHIKRATIGLDFYISFTKISSRKH